MTRDIPDLIEAVREAAYMIERYHGSMFYDWKETIHEAYRLRRLAEKIVDIMESEEEGGGQNDS